MMMNRLLLAALAFVAVFANAQSARAEITRVWLSHRTSDPSKLVVNWESAQPGDSVVRFAADEKPFEEVSIDELVTLHHVEIPLAEKNTKYRYSVQTGKEQSAEATFKAYPTDVLRVAVVADWAGRPNLASLIKDDVHLLLTAGDNIGSLHQRCGPGVADCTKPYEQLIDAYPALFRSTPFLPALGNHDREIRPRGDKPPPEPVYDVDATAFRKFFELPGDEWKWHFGLPEFGARFIALDLNHISDQGTTYQTCHPLDQKSEQFVWYEKLMTGPKPPLVITLQNERNATMRSQAGGDWGKLFARGTLAVSGFGYFAERAEVDGFTYYNTALGTGAKYPDPKSQFFASVANYLLLTFANGRLTAELKSLNGAVLDRKEFPYVGGTKVN
jgi:hypothetical protein